MSVNKESQSVFLLQQKNCRQHRFERATMSATILLFAPPAPSLRLLLRRVHYIWTIDREKSLQLLVNHQHEFPVKIREFIQEAHNESEAGTSAASVMMRLYDKTMYFFLCKRENNENTQDEESTVWYGPNIDVDTEEELEVAIRFFPHILRETRPRDKDEWAAYPIQKATTNLKSLPFVPLMAELGKEYHIYNEKERGGLWENYDDWEYERWEQTTLHEIMTNRLILKKEPAHNEEFYRKIDTVSLDVLVRLKQKGFLKRQDMWDCVKIILNEKVSRTEKRLLFFIHWDPFILKTHRNQDVEDIYRALCTSLLEVCVWNFYLYGNLEGMLERFKTLIELGLRYYPDQIGFLFHRDDLFEPGPKPAFPTACDMFGQEQVVSVVNECISKYTRGKRHTFHKFVFLAATKKEILLDGLYLLIRRDPGALIPLLSKASKSTTRTIETKPSTKPLTKTAEKRARASAQDAADFWRCCYLFLGYCFFVMVVIIWAHLCSKKPNVTGEL